MLNATPARQRRARSSAVRPELKSFSTAAVNAVIGLLATLLGTGILSLFTIYVKVATLTDAITTVSETQQKQLADGVSERQYQRDQAAVYEAIRGLATKQEVAAVARRLDDQMAMLNKIEDGVLRIDLQRKR